MTGDQAVLSAPNLHETSVEIGSQLLHRTRTNFMSDATAELVSDAGQGRPWIILRETSCAAYDDLARHATEDLLERVRVVSIRLEIDPLEWRKSVGDLEALLLQRGLKHASYLAFGASGMHVQHLALTGSRYVRTALLVDPSSRAHPSKMLRTIDRIERALPLGLPLRSGTAAFDSKPFLQRIRCPVMIALSRNASAYQRHEAEFMASSIPTAWSITLPHEGERKALVELLAQFQDVAVKCPQKNR